MKPDRVVSINEQAIENIRYIRETMERAGSFTAVPGWGGVLMGVSALLAAFVSNVVPSGRVWLAVWLGEALLALGIGAWAVIQKAAAAKAPLLGGTGRKFALSLLPAIVAGFVVTGALYRYSMFALMPGVWLLLYGAAVVSGGAHSVKVVPIMGMSFMALGTVALFSSPEWTQWYMGGGFGGLHIVFGIIIARQHGG
jgi:hypothetical protein